MKKWIKLITPKHRILFGNSENELYYEFGERYFHIFLFCYFIMRLQILIAQFPSIGKGVVGTVVSHSRQVFFLLPLAVIFPLICGIDGVLFVESIADGASSIMGLLHKIIKKQLTF